MSSSTPALADEAACFAATLRFFRSLDARDHETCVAAFASGGAWHRQGKRLDTAEAMLASLEARPKDRTTSHVITNLISEAIDADRLVVRFILTAYDGAIPADGSVPVGRLAGMMDGRDEYVRTAEGWRLIDKSTRGLFKGA
ncbi:MAG: nuclear transport factor 2 family protein [Burkholderiaceae bacterium]